MHPRISIGLIISIVIVLAFLLVTMFLNGGVLVTKFFDLFYQLAIGYIVSFIFFILQVYIPDIKNQKKAFEIIKNQVGSLSYDLLDIVFVIEKCTTISKDEFVINQPLIYFVRFRKGENENGAANKIELSYSDIYEYESRFKRDIEGIVSNSLYSQNDHNIISAIANLQSNTFFPMLLAKLEANQKTIPVCVSSIYEDFLSFRESINLLWKKTHDYEEYIEELSSSEINIYESRLKYAPDLTGTKRLCFTKNKQ